MAVKAVQVNVVTSLDAFLELAVTVVADVKAGKSPQQVVTDAVPLFVASLQGVSDLASDLTNRKDVEVTVALKLAALVDAVTN